MTLEEWVDKRVKVFHRDGGTSTVVLFTKDPALFENPGTIKATGIFFEGTGDGRVGFAVESNDSVGTRITLNVVLGALIHQYLKETSVQ